MCGSGGVISPKATDFAIPKRKLSFLRESETTKNTLLRRSQYTSLHSMDLLSSKGGICTRAAAGGCAGGLLSTIASQSQWQ